MLEELDPSFGEYFISSQIRLLSKAGENERVLNTIATLFLPEH